jgi:membrane fusion protein (multidrug efflux system)
MKTDASPSLIELEPTEFPVADQADLAAATVANASPVAERQGSGDPQKSTVEASRGARPRRPIKRIVGVSALAVVLCLFAFFGLPSALRFLRYESTDDAFVDGHVTYLSPRINGTVTDVLVDDNQHVEQGEVLVRLDAQSLKLAVEQKRAALASAKLMIDQHLAALDAGQAELDQARNQVRGQLAAIRGDWYMLETIRTLIRYQVASVRSSIANLKLQEANLANMQSQYDRGSKLVVQSAMSTEEFEQRRTALAMAKEQVSTAKQSIRQSRALLGLAPDDAHGDEVPADIEESFPGVQYALSGVQQTLAQLGLPFDLSNMKTGSIMDRITQMAGSSAADQAPAVQLAEAHLRQAKAALGGAGFDPAHPYSHPAVVQAQKDLEQAELDLSYAEIRAPITGFISRRTVNTGNRVQVGQALLAIHSLNDVWIDANFKEAQLHKLQIGQPVDISVDAYPDRVFHGRVAGFSSGTGAAMSLLPPENATGNFVKVVQRLPVRIELTEPVPADAPLFIGLSAVPDVDIAADPSGSDAGQRLRGRLR